MKTSNSQDDPNEVEAFYSLGALGEQELVEVEARLHSGETELRDAIFAFDEVATELSEAITPVTPPARVKAKLLQSLAPKPRLPQGFRVQHQADIVWRATGQPGVQYCDLNNDPQTRRVTRLLKMEPGARLESHHHDTAEEFYVISGDLHCGDIHLSAGDYQYAEAGTHHAELISETGCFCLILTM